MNIIVTGIIVIGLFFLNEVRVDFLTLLKYSFGGIGFDGIGGDLKSIRLIVKLRVSNGTSYSIPIEGFTGEIFFKEKLLAPLKQQEAITVKANNATVLNYIVPVGKSQLESVFGSWNTALLHLKEAANMGNYRLKGVVTIRIKNIVYYQDIDMTF